LGAPDAGEHILLSGSPNPVASDQDLALLHAEGIEAGMSAQVSARDTGILLFNHGLFAPERKYFDPKIDDTIVLCKNIKAALLKRHPELDPANIIGAYGGTQELNPENGLVERTRRMRGEDIAYAHPYGADNDMPEGAWGYRYWDGLEYLMGRGVKHLVIGFPQIVTDSVLTLVEVYNQIGKEIGVKTWLKHRSGDFSRYPGTGHPFADYWGNWVDTTCAGTGRQCCLTMGGCKDGGAYPPLRQTPLDQKREDMDPSLAFDLSDYGHLGYDPAAGAPDPEKPVQQQYAGTWEVYTPANNDKRIGRMLAAQVLHAAVCPLVYITNGRRSNSMCAGESLTFDAHCAGGAPEYSYAWSIKKNEEERWHSTAQKSASWTWRPGKDDRGTYRVRCTVTDANGNSGEAVFENFSVAVP
ncbi:MAG: PKD domain-containing protein, partial [Pseudomonadota bacterium]